MGLRLIPERGGRDVGILLQVAAVVAPAKVLDGDLQAFVEADRIHDMPAVKAESFLRTVCAVGTNDLTEACVGGAEFGESSFTVEVVGPAKVVFGSGSADRGELVVSVHEELDLAFAPPAVVVEPPCHVDTYILAFFP